MHYSMSNLLFAGLIVCVHASATSSMLSIYSATPISVSTTLSYSSKNSFTTAYLSSTISLEFLSISTTTSSKISSHASSSSRTSTSGIASSVISSIASSSSVSTVSSFDLTTSTSTSISTSTTTSCSATPSSTNPCPKLQLVGNDPEPLDEDKPITDEKVGECENWLESNVEPPESPADSPEYKAWDQMRDRCSRIENVDKNVAIRKEYILEQSSVFRYECVQEAVAWLKKHADKIPGLPEWLEEHKDDWHSPCGPGI